MLLVQDRIVWRYRSGRRRGAAMVSLEVFNEVINRHERLTSEQVELVRAFCISGRSLQCAVGQPGAGKTTSMLAAREAWEAAGFRVMGAAVKGEAARTLAVATGIPTETLAWHLAHDDPHTSPLDSRTVLVVDEASTISDRDLDRLTWLANQTGATLRLIGDPAQHGAVEAGGMFRVLCERHPADTPELTQTHRLRDPHDRAAAAALRDGNVEEALWHLAAAGHLHIVDDELDAYIQVLAAWWQAHQDGFDHPMIDRRNSVRRTLNRLAHGLRAANGELGPHHMLSGERRFAVGDRVIARQPHRRLHPAGEPTAYVRNGAVGTIVGVDPRNGPAADDGSIAVAFDHVGTIVLPRNFVDEHDTGQGRREVGLDHAYAVTSYAVTGATQPVSTSRIDETSSRAETYVDITRGEQANHLYLTRAADPLDGEHLPRTPPDPIADAVAERLRRSQGERTAWEIRQDKLDSARPAGTVLGL
jgi:ATP-dependent exoDNAse (exonuclease V) alpha subunit